MFAPEAFYTPAKRPSGHDISGSFGKDNGGAIPSNLLQIPNTESNGGYLSGCKLLGIKSHPARSPAKLPEFFIKFLTEPGDLVVDIFGGSNTTGAVAETLDRKWLSFELEREYVAASVLRFMDGPAEQEIRRAYMAKVWIWRGWRRSGWVGGAAVVVCLNYYYHPPIVRQNMRKY